MSLLKKLKSTAAGVASALALAAAPAAFVAAPAAQAQVAPGMPAPITSSENTGSLLRQQGCKPRYLIAVPGGANTIAGVPTFMPHGGQVFSTGLIVQSASGGDIQPLWVSYNSGAFAMRPYYTTSNEAYAATLGTVNRLASACPGSTFSFTGYSLGADVAARLTRDIAYGNGPIPPERVDGVALIANPYQGGNGAALAPGTHEWSRGALGELRGGYGVLAPKVLEICRGDDIVCSPNDYQRGFVEPAMRTNLLGGQFPVREFEKLLRDRGLQAFDVFAGMAAHGGYTLTSHQQAADWIVSHAY